MKNNLSAPVRREIAQMRANKVTENRQLNRWLILTAVCVLIGAISAAAAGIIPLN